MEGDLVRPLGFVTLHWAYAEAELDEVVGLLSMLSSSPDAKALMFGAKVPLALKLIEAIGDQRLSKLAATLQEAHPLIAQRNELVHGQLFNGGRLVLKGGIKHVTAEEITDLAEHIFSWKEHLWQQKCRELLPMAAAARTKGNAAQP